MRKIDDGERKKEKEKRKKITVEIVATNVVASRPPNGDRLQRRPLVPIFRYVPAPTPPPLMGGENYLCAMKQIMYYIRTLDYL